MKSKYRKNYQNIDNNNNIFEDIKNNKILKDKIEYNININNVYQTK